MIMTMYWMLDLSQPGTLVTVFITTIMLLKKFADMDRYHDLRVLILTLFFSFIVLFFFLTYCLTLGTPIDYCQPEHFCTTEM